MTTKTTGAELKKFYADDDFWPQGSWHEDEVIDVNGEPYLDDDILSIPGNAIVRVSGGVMRGMHDDKEVSFEAFFKSWRKRQNTVTFIVQCHKDNAFIVQDAIKCVGGKVL